MRIVYLIIGICGAVIGALLSMLHWLSTDQRGANSLSSWFAILAFTGLPILLCHLFSKNKRISLCRFSAYLVLSMLVAYFLSPSTSSTRDQRITKLFSDPFFAFRPWYFVVAACIGLILGLWSKDVFLRNKHKPE